MIFEAVFIRICLIINEIEDLDEFSNCAYLVRRFNSVK